MCVCWQWIRFRVAHPSCSIVDVLILLTPISARPLPDSRVAKEMFSITRFGIKCDRELQKVCVYLYYHPCRSILGRSTPHVVIRILVLSSLSVNVEMLPTGSERIASRRYVVTVPIQFYGLLYYLYTTDDSNRIFVWSIKE